MGDRSSRFSVYVPEPEARLNMGRPIHKPEDATAFGYTGVSVQSSMHLFIDVNKHTLVQGWGNSMWQMAGKVLQYSGGDTVMASGGASLLAASSRMVITAGAGQGSYHALDHGMPHMAPRMNDYNRLDLHYQVEGAHNGVKALFYGEKSWKKAQEDPQAAQLTQAESGYAGGLLEDLRARMEEVGHAPNTITAALQPLEWEGNRIEMRNGPAGGPASVYPPLAAFDPYPVASARSPVGVAAIFGRYLQTVNFFHRFVDVLQRIMPALTENNFVAARLQTLISVWENACLILPASLRVADLARWNRADGSHSDAWTKDEWAGVATRHETAKGFDPTKATLTSSPSPYTLTGDMKLKVRDAPGGAWKELTLSSQGTAASPISIRFADGYEAIQVAEAEGAQVNLGLGVATFRGGSWVDVPDGFQVAGGVFSREDGELFSWVPRTGGPTITPQASGSVTVVVDGVSHTVSWAEIGVVPKAQRATKLKEQLARFDGTKVTSELLGAASMIEVPGSKWFGTSDEQSTRGADAGTASWLAAQLNALGLNFVATESTDSGRTVCALEHNDSGESSYLEIKDGPTELLFGSDPAQDQGKSPSALENHSTLAELQVEVSTYPLDVQNTMRPVIEAFKDVMSVYDTIKSLADNLLDLAGLKVGPPSSLGLFSGDGITLGTGDKLFSVSEGITLISASAGDPDERKFAMGPVEKWLSKIGDWDPLQEYWKNRDQGHPFQVKKKPTHPESTAVRIVSGSDVMVMAADDIRTLAVGCASVEGNRVDLIAHQGGVHIGARDSNVQVQGKYLLFGLEGKAAGGAQAATEAIRLVSAKKVELKTKEAAAVVNEGVIQIGARGSAAFEVSLDAPRLYVKAAAGGGEVGIGTGDNSGAVAHGVLVASSGDVLVNGNSKVTLQSGQGGLEITSSGVTLNGQLKVGSELVIKGSGVLSPKVLVKSQVALKTEQIRLKGEYATLMVKAQGFAQGLVALEAAWDALTKTIGMALFPPIRAGISKQAAALKDQYSEMRTKLQALEDERANLIAEGQLHDLDLAGLGGSPADDQVFS